MAFVQFTQPDDQPIVINTDRIVTAPPLPDGQGTRITFNNGGHQDVIAVGTLISKRPPHRTVRAAFPHTAPALGG